MLNLVEYIYPYNNQTIQYLINNKNDMLKHPVGTLIHTTLPDFPWIIQLQSAVKKRKSGKNDFYDAVLLETCLYPWL